MILSLMSFSFMRDAFTRKMDADKLCKLARANGLDTLDLMGMEIRLYGAKKLKKALAEKHRTSVTDIALRYVFGGKMNTFAIMSTTSPKRLPGNVLAANQPLTADEVAFLENDSE